MDWRDPPSRVLLPHVGVLALVPDCWGPHWESRHHMMSRLATYFNVIWLEPPHGWRDSIRMLRRSRRLNPEPPQGLHVYRPGLWLPRFYHTPWLDDLTRRAQLRIARKRLTSLGCSKFVLHIWRPDFAFALEDVAADFILYHVDDEYSLSEADPDPNEAMLLERADQVIVHSAALMQKKGHINPHTALIPNGVAFGEYALPRSEPPDLVGIPRPRIGYSGHLKRQLNWRLIRDLVGRHPEWSFVFVGKMRPHAELPEIIDDLFSYPNVYCLGAKTVHELAAYPQHFDCCLMPYDETIYTNQYGYPMKLHEYLASGRPAVGTPIEALKEFSQVVELASTPEEWSAAIQRALSPAANTLEKRQARQAVARRHDWDALACRVAEVIARGVGEPFPAEAELYPKSAPRTT